MPSKGGLMNGQFGATHTSRYEDEYNSLGKMPTVKQLGPRPTSGLRRNNPHPTSDFLLPKNLKKMDADQKFQSHVQSAVRDHLMKLYQTGNVSNQQLAEIIRKTLGERRSPVAAATPEAISPSAFMRESEMMENYVNPTEDALERIIEDDRLLLKREQGNSFKKAGKVYRDISDEKEQLDERAKPLYLKISRKPQLGSDVDKAHWIQWPKAHPPTPGGRQGLNDSLVAQYNAKYPSDGSKLPQPTKSSAEPMKTKRLHTPPTPPEHSSRRVKSAAYEAQVRSMRTQSQEGHVRSKSASPLLEKDEDRGSDVPSNKNLDTIPQLNDTNPDLATSSEDTYIQRPKTAGPQLAKSMIMHPRMKSWIDTATDYEKQVAYSMLRTISGRKTTDDEFNKLDAKLNCTPAKPRPVRKTWATPSNKMALPPATHTFDAYVPPSPAPVKPVPNRNGKKDRVTNEQWMSLVEQTINDRMTPQERDRTTIQMLPRGSQQRPHARHQPRPKAPKDYRHENSFFNFTKKPPTGQFTISPDWVSEHMKPRRKPKKPLDVQLRYGSMV